MQGKIDIDRLFFWTDLFGIKVVFRNLRPGLLGSADAWRKIITLDESLRDRPRLMKCVLAEEIGHILYPPRPGHIRYHSTGFWETEYLERSHLKVIVAQDERKALTWATGVLIPDVEFWRAIGEKHNTIYKLADYFEVEDWFVWIKIGYIRRKASNQGQRLKWRDIIRR
ncbi:MAG TPA: hypothetical protein DEF34_10300 [Desulfotomaculum sp.]|nr:MAG: hypothetical protein JL56_05755 [Desulfotomaculum sp. BICA1-6]HBX24005.1 hypothetical protein [Desulfotomaculum sp.]